MWPGALILFELIAPRATAQRGSAYVTRVRSLFLRAVKRGADACAVGGDVYAAALETEVWVFCFPTVACGVVGEECGAQIALEHNVQRNGFSCFLVVAVIGGFLVRLGFFDPCGGDLLTVVDCVSCAERDAAAGSGFLGAGFTEDVVCAGFVADGDGVTVCEGECDGAAACGGFRDCGSGEHAGERLCRLVVCVAVGGIVGGAAVGVHGVSSFFVVGFCSGCSLARADCLCLHVWMLVCRDTLGADVGLRACGAVS